MTTRDNTTQRSTRLLEVECPAGQDKCDAIVQGPAPPRDASAPVVLPALRTHERHTFGPGGHQFRTKDYGNLVQSYFVNKELACSVQSCSAAPAPAAGPEILTSYFADRAHDAGLVDSDDAQLSTAAAPVPATRGRVVEHSLFGGG